MNTTIQGPHFAQITLTVAMAAARDQVAFSELPAFPETSRIAAVNAIDIEIGTASEEAWSGF